MTTDYRLNLAAIDIGTNTIKMAVVSADPRTGAFELTDKERLIVRLGSGSGDMEHIGKKVFKRGISALRHLKMIADAAKARIRAVATSAVREAGNRADFIAAARQIGVRVETISGTEEARLIFLGIRRSLDLGQKKVLMMTIGGGSTELLVARGEKIFFDRSLKLGAVRLTESFFKHGYVTKGAVRKCREHIRGTIAPVIREMRPLGYGQVVASSGTFTAVAQMIGGHKGESRSKVTGFSFTAGELNKLSSKLTGLRTVGERQKVRGLEPGRADIIVAGVLIIEELMKAIKVRAVTVSDFGLREGLLFDAIGKAGEKAGRRSSEDVKTVSINKMIGNCKADHDHARQVARLSVQLFDQLLPFHHLGPEEKHLLEAAARLHDTGFLISHSQHHKHSYYLIRNSELLGFTEDEKELIANIARYHRKSFPKSKHRQFAALPKKDQRTVSFLSAILRVADGLDRNRQSCISKVRVVSKKNVLTIKPKGRKGRPLDLDLWGAGRKKDLLEKVLGRKVKIMA